MSESVHSGYIERTRTRKENEERESLGYVPASRFPRQFCFFDRRSAAPAFPHRTTRRLTIPPVSLLAVISRCSNRLRLAPNSSGGIQKPESRMVIEFLALRFPARSFGAGSQETRIQSIETGPAPHGFVAFELKAEEFRSDKSRRGVRYATQDG
jgi:hypothetical protein